MLCLSFEKVQLLPVDLTHACEIEITHRNPRAQVSERDKDGMLQLAPLTVTPFQDFHS